eukprot:5303336-Pyramimonas_sp.AAC.2
MSYLVIERPSDVLEVCVLEEVRGVRVTPAPNRGDALAPHVLVDVAVPMHKHPARRSSNVNALRGVVRTLAVTGTGGPVKAKHRRPVTVTPPPTAFEALRYTSGKESNMSLTCKLERTCTSMRVQACTYATCVRAACVRTQGACPQRVRACAPVEHLLHERLQRVDAAVEHFQRPAEGVEAAVVRLALARLVLLRSELPLCGIACLPQLVRHLDER